MQYHKDAPEIGRYVRDLILNCIVIFYILKFSYYVSLSFHVWFTQMKRKKGKE